MFKGNYTLRKIFLMGFLLALQMAFTAYVNSSFLAQFSGEKNVGLIFMCGSVASLLLLFVVPGLLNRAGAYRFMLWSSGLSVFAMSLLAVTENPFLVIPVFVSYFALNGLIIFALDELIEIFSDNSLTGSVRGLYLTVLNLAWVLSQLATGRMLSELPLSSVYAIGAMIMAVFFATAFAALKRMRDPRYDKTVAWQSVKRFFAHKKLARSYKINLLLQFFYAWMVIYTPLYLHAHIGFDWGRIGIIFTVMLLPFVLIQYPLGKYSDKTGERGMLMLGFSIVALATFSIFFIEGQRLWLWAFALFMTRVGAATVEVMSDVYFFKHITRENDEFVSIYRNTGALSYLIAPPLAVLVFFVAPAFSFIYVILSAIMLYGIYLASTIRKSDI